MIHVTYAQDEALFASSSKKNLTGNRDAPQGSGTSANFFTGQPVSAPVPKQKPEVVQVITKDLIRTIKFVSSSSFIMLIGLI